MSTLVLDAKKGQQQAAVSARTSKSKGAGGVVVTIDQKALTTKGEALSCLRACVTKLENSDYPA